MALFVIPRSSAYGQNVKPSDGAKLYFYEAGTTTLKTVYSDFEETIALSNPVVANASGRFATVFLSGMYKVVLTDKNDVQIWEQDNLQGTSAGLNYLGGFDSSTNSGDYPATGQTGDLYKVTSAFTLNPASGSHYLYEGDFIMSNKPNATAIDGDWDIIKGRVWLIDEDDMASDSAVLAPSQQSVKHYVDFSSVVVVWNVSTTYAIGDYVKASDNKLYRALVSQSGNDPSGGADPTNWLPFGDLLDVLTSTDTTRGLTAAQGKVLKDLIDSLTAGIAPQATETATGFSFLRKRIIGSNGTDALHDIDTTAGNFKFSGGDGSANIGAFTKQIDATWTAGTNQGGRAAGVSLLANTWYHYYALSSSDGATVDFGFDTSTSAVNLLADAAVIAAGITKYERQLSVLTDGSSDIIPFFQIEKEFRWKIRRVALSTTTPGTTGILLAVDAPFGLETMAIMKMAAASTIGGHYGLITSPDENDSIPSASAFTAVMDAIGGVSITETGSEIVKTNFSSQIRYRSSISPVILFDILILGWVDLNLED